MACAAAPSRVTQSLLLDEHYSDAIAAQLRAAGHDAVAIVADPELRAQSDLDVFRRAAASRRLIVTENGKAFRPLLLHAYAAGEPVAQLLLVPPNPFPGGTGRRTAAIVAALSQWCAAADVAERPD